MINVCRIVAAVRASETRLINNEEAHKFSMHRARFRLIKQDARFGAKKNEMPSQKMKRKSRKGNRAI